MPGSSLWLIPPPNRPFTRSLNTWITATVPYRFSSAKPPTFIPHITLTSNIPYGPDDGQPFDAQVWLDCLELPIPDAEDEEQIVIDLRSLVAGEQFFKKLTLKADKDNEPLEKLAVACRAQGVYSGDFEKARSWAKDYDPHLSVMYGDMPLKEADKMIPALIQDFDRAKAIFKPKKDGTAAIGGSIVLVPTDKGIPQWKPIASRQIPGMIWKYNVM